MENTQIRIVPVSEDLEFRIVFDIRHQVFQQEMGIDEEDDLDGNDHIAHHILALWEDRPVGTARWRISLGGKVALERFAVLKDYRNRGIGTALVRSMLKVVPGGREIFLESHEATVGFYEKLGFVREGETYNFKNVAFQKMIWPD